MILCRTANYTFRIIAWLKLKDLVLPEGSQMERTVVLSRLSSQQNKVALLLLFVKGNSLLIHAWDFSIAHQPPHFCILFSNCIIGSERDVEDGGRLYRVYKRESGFSLVSY